MVFGMVDYRKQHFSANFKIYLVHTSGILKFAEICDLEARRCKNVRQGWKRNTKPDNIFMDFRTGYVIGR